jgi:hypothetical protein
VPYRHETSRAQDAAEHRDQQQQAKLAEIPIVKPEEPGPEACCQVRCSPPHGNVGLASMLSHFTRHNSVMQTAAIIERLSGVRVGRILAGHEGLQ